LFVEEFVGVVVVGLVEGFVGVGLVGVVEGFVGVVVVGVVEGFVGVVVIGLVEGYVGVGDDVSKPSKRISPDFIIVIPKTEITRMTVKIRIELNFMIFFYSIS